jgi:hypothetical protein
MRIVVAVTSVVVLVFAATALLWSEDANADAERLLAGKRGRSWWRFAAAFFTGELLYERCGWRWRASEEEGEGVDGDGVGNDDTSSAAARVPTPGARQRKKGAAR